MVVANRWERQRQSSASTRQATTGAMTSTAGTGSHYLSFHDSSGHFFIVLEISFSWREREGQLCRNNTDCKWLDNNLQVIHNKDLFGNNMMHLSDNMCFLLNSWLPQVNFHTTYFQCSDYKINGKLGFTPSIDWFNGDSASIVGQCECPENMDWDDYELECYVSFCFTFPIFDTFGPVKRNTTYLQPGLKPKCHDNVHDHNQNISQHKKITNWSKKCARPNRILCVLLP